MKMYLENQAEQIQKEVKSDAGSIQITEEKNSANTASGTPTGQLRRVSETTNYSSVFTLPAFNTGAANGNTNQMGQVLPRREVN
jgi:hypothetical protein